MFHFTNLNNINIAVIYLKPDVDWMSSEICINRSQLDIIYYAFTFYNMRD